MYVPDTSPLYSDIDGQRFYFCSRSCQEKYTSPQKAQKTLGRRLAVAWPLAIIVLMITYLAPSSIPFRNYLLLLLTVPVQFYSGYMFYEGAYHSIKSRSANMDLLVSLGTLTAFVFSAFVTLFPGRIAPPGDVYFDASVFIITLILTGNFIENLTKVQANKAASKLVNLIPAVSHVIIEDGSLVEEKTENVREGYRVMVKPGEIIAVDGIVYEGKSEVDESMLTGEQEPVLRTVGQEVSSGTRNLNGILKIRVTRTGRNSTVNQIYEMIQRAASGRAKVQRIADVFSSVFVPVVLAAALSSSLFWYLFLATTGHSIAPVIAILVFVSVVVIACPCAIGLAAPITLLISSNISSSNGIIVKNSSALDRLSKANRVVFDKTGTLTEMDPVINEFHVADGSNEDYVLAMAATLESSSNHPVAKAIVSMARDRKLNLMDATDVVEMPGIGIKGKINGKEVSVSRAKEEGGSTVSITIDGQYIGSFSLSYRTRKGAKEAVDRLRSLGISISMITGDSSGEARRIGMEVGIDDIHSEVLPSGKSEIIKQYQEKGDYVIFVGDGINDTVALETADVGIAMASGTDIARESGDIILINNDLKRVVDAIIIGRRTIAKIKQNIGWAFGYNAVLIPVAAGILVPFFGLSIYSFLPILSALAMGMSSSSVVLNSLLLNGKISRSLAVMSSVHPSP